MESVRRVAVVLPIRLQHVVSRSRLQADSRSGINRQIRIQSHRYRLKQFVQWCEQDGIDNLNEFSGRDIHRFRVKRRNEDGLATASMKEQLATLRIFLRFCATIDAVESGLDEKILLPTTTEDDARSELLNPDRAPAGTQIPRPVSLRTLGACADGSPLAYWTSHRSSYRT